MLLVFSSEMAKRNGCCFTGDKCKMFIVLLEMDVKTCFTKAGCKILFDVSLEVSCLYIWLLLFCFNTWTFHNI
jgi:hypothetical protein